MTFKELIPILLQASMALIVFAVALGATTPVIQDLRRKPGLILRSLIAMNVIMPLFAIALARLFRFDPSVEVAIVTLALSPVPPILPRKESKAGGTTSYILGLLGLASLVSIAYVPLAVHIIGTYLGRPMNVTGTIVAKAVLISVLAPLIAGLIVVRLAPSIAPRIAPPLERLGGMLLVIACVPIVIRMWPAMVALIGNFTLVAIALFVLGGLVVGHMLGGPDPNDRTVLALSNATRHPGVAIGIAHAAGSDEPNVVAAVFLCLLVAIVVCAPYTQWRRRGVAVHVAERAR
jgi:BASS family bile acid:Na+ symporter